MFTPWKESYHKPRQCIKKQIDYFADKGPSSQIYNFSSNHVGMWELDHKEGWAPKDWCFWTVVLWILLRVLRTARRSNHSILKKSVLNIHWKDWWWSWSSSTLVTWWEELTPCKRPWYWERLKAGGEGDNIGWDGWMKPPTQWTWVWASSGRCEGQGSLCTLWWSMGL